MAKIGFIGLGHMGKPMTMNLLQADHNVRVFDINSQAMQELVSHGAVETKSAIEAATNVDVVFTMLQNGDQVLKTCLGDNGIFQAMSKDAIYIDSSSIAISATRQLHAKAKQMGLTMFDAPVSGGVKGAVAASLTIMVGGQREKFAKAKHFLAHLGKKVIYAGPPGSGQVAKICNNMILGISMIAVSEAFILGEKLGLEPKKFYEIVSQASGQCWSLTSYCPMPNIIENVPANNDYQPGFTAAMMLKDLKLAQDAASIAQITTKLGSLASEIYQVYVDASCSERDFSGIIQMIQASAQSSNED